MKVIRKLITTIMLVTASGVACAGGWGPSVTITNYFLWGHGGACIRTAANHNPDGCATFEMLYLDTNDVQFKGLWAMIIAAHAAGNSVSVQVDGCTNGRPHVRAVAVPAIW